MSTDEDPDYGLLGFVAGVVILLVGIGGVEVHGLVLELIR